MNIFVSNLPPDVDTAALAELFRPYGDVISARVIMDKATARSKGYGFVEMGDTDGSQAIQALNGMAMAGKPVSVVVSKPKTDNGTFLLGSRRSGPSGGSRRVF